MKRWLLFALPVTAVVFLAAWAVYTAHTDPADWQLHVSPGELSSAHANLERRCAACHVAVEGPGETRCIGCHANNTALLQRQPTAFHANIGSCARCHVEHQGRDANLRQMDHEMLAQVGLARLGKATSENGPLEMTLNCNACHATKDRHSGLFGRECASCHATTAWTIARFQHPSSQSIDCAQCHQAPPSHYMMHFEMVSKRVARQEDSRVAACCGPAQVNQCYRCHQTTSWNDIKGVGWYKHH